MKNKYIKIVIMFSLLMSVTGCATYVKDENKKIVKNPETGQNVIENILCRPESEETIQIYKDNNINIEALPKCKDFNLTDSNYEGLWVTFFIKPLSTLLIKLGMLFNNYGLSIIMVTLLLRLVAYPITKKTAEQSEYMKLAKPELDKIEKKYKGKTDQPSLMSKSQETMVIYKKYNLNPMSSLFFAIMQAFLFFAFYESINRIPVLFEGNFLGIFQLGTTTMRAVELGQYHYLIINFLIIGTTYLSFKLNKTASMTPEQERQMNIMSKFMIALITFVSFNLAVGIGIYWIFNSTFTIIQNLIVKRSKKND